MNTPSITFDTSCLISLLRLPEDSTPIDEILALEQIQQWHVDGDIEIFISEKSRTEAMLNVDIARNSDPENTIRFEKWLSTLRLMGNYETVGGVWILGVSRLGVDTVLGSDADSDAYMKIAKLLFDKEPSHLKDGDVFDLAILYEHYRQSNDLFVTRDKKNGILKKGLELEKLWGISVSGPVDAELVIKNRLMTG